MTRFARLWVVAVFLSSAAFAQAKPLEDKKGVSFNEIERGFFFEARGGFWSIVNPPTTSGGTTYFSPGLAAQVDMGFDIGERVSPSIFLLAATNSMKSDYTGLSANGTVSGDFSTLAPGAQVKVRIVGFNDSQDVQRTWIYARGGAAVVFYSPSSLLPTMDVLITAGPGVEYFTRLRHFSIGIEANFNFMVLTQSIGFSVLPTVKYAF
ncbi:MAG: adventurous gliding motility protein CglE [Myxococcota bacterium]